MSNRVKKNFIPLCHAEWEKVMLDRDLFSISHCLYFISHLNKAHLNMVLTFPCMISETSSSYSNHSSLEKWMREKNVHGYRVVPNGSIIYPESENGTYFSIHDFRDKQFIFKCELSKHIFLSWQKMIGKMFALSLLLLFGIFVQKLFETNPNFRYFG